MASWVGHTAADIAAAVRAGQVTARDVVSQHLDRIARLNPELGAFVRVRPEAALLEADEVDRRADRGSLPLAGVPVAIKDNLPVRGEPMRVGSAATPEEPQEADHPVVALLRQAGAVIVGLTNLPEMSLYPFTDSVFGISRNPWNTRRTAGGSSGGSATAVASAMVPIAVANDGLGSIRIPAAVCGLFGIKPGPGVVPSQIGRDSWGGMAENGPLATTVHDAALMLGVLAGTDFSLAEPPRLRVAVSVDAPTPGVRVQGDLVAAVRNCGGELSRLGHRVTFTDPPYPLWSANATLARWFTVGLPDLQPYLGGPGLEKRTRRHIRAGQRWLRPLRPRDSDRERLRAKLDPFFSQCDVLVMPALARRCPAARRWGGGTLTRSVTAALLYSPMAGIWNLAGYPAASVPAGTAGRGMPGSVQLVAAPGGEARLLAVAAQLEQAGGWPRYPPAYAPPETAAAG